MQTTSQTWKDLLASGAPLEARATIGGTVVTAISQPVITRACMQESMGIGNVAAASLALAVRGTATIPRSASVFIETRLNDGETASEWLPQGTFYIARRARDPVTGAVALECYDALLKANAVWEPSAGSWPRAMGAVLTELLALLGLTLDSRSAIPSGAPFAIAEPAAGTTIRDVLSVIAQAGGGNWIVTPQNRLRLVPLADAADAAAATADAVDVDGVTGGMDVGPTGTITGVRCTVDGVVTLTGDETGIVVDVSIAPVIAAELAEALIGRRYQAYSLDGAVCDPAAELGDYVRAGANGEIASVLYGERLDLGPACRSDVSAPQAGEVTDEYPYIGGTVKALTLAKAYAEEAVDALDSDLTQQEIFNRLTDNGAAQGIVLYNGQLYINAGYINAGYLSAARIKGDTLTLGGDNNVNGVLRVLDANGNVITTLNNSGADIINGSITTYSTDQQTRTILSDGILKFQFYNSYAQPIGWLDALRIAADSQSATIGTFAGISQLDIKGRGRVYISNQDAVTDEHIAELDLDDDLARLHAYTFGEGTTNLDVQGDGLTLTIDNQVGDPFIFHLIEGQSDHPLSIGNGGTGANTAAGARANLGITPANIGAVAKSGDTMTGPLTVPNMVVRSGSWQFYFMQDSNGAEVGHVRGDEATHHIAFREITPGINSACEDYYLPIPTIQSGAVGYYILTSKYAVTVSQGGTGATTPDGACANIGAVKKTGDTMTGALTVQSDVIALTDTAKGNLSLYMHISGSGDFGIYSNGYYNGSSFVSSGKWLVYRDTNDVIRLGNAVPVDNGGTGATTAAGARTNLGLYSTKTLTNKSGHVLALELSPTSASVLSVYMKNSSNNLITGVLCIPYLNSNGNWEVALWTAGTMASYTASNVSLIVNYRSL